jgi:hypothetical protein
MSSATDRPIHRYSVIDGSLLRGQCVMSPQRPAPAARNTDEIVVPGRIGVVVASCVLTAGASPTERLPRRVHPARSPGQATCCTGPVVDARIDTRHSDRRNGFEPPQVGHRGTITLPAVATGRGNDFQSVRRGSAIVPLRLAFSGGTARQTRRSGQSPRESESTRLYHGMTSIAWA